MAPHRFDQRLRGQSYPCVQFVTRTRAEFCVWRQRFDEERRKIVPIDIDRDLSPLALAVWIMDDGAADYAGLTLQSHSFTSDETNRLAAVLRAEYGLRTGTRANRGSEIIYVYAETLPRLEEIRCPARPSRASVQADSASIQNPVETIRWLRVLARVMT